MTSTGGLPPGQRAVKGFSRFGTHLHALLPPPAPGDPRIEVGGAVTEPLSLSLPEISALGRRELSADLHCVSGWSATGLRWDGVLFETVYRALIVPVVSRGASITQVVRLDGRPLDADHGAPVRLVAPSHYGFINTKQLCRIELCTSEPRDYGSASRAAAAGLRPLGYRRLPRRVCGRRSATRSCRPGRYGSWAGSSTPQIGRLSARGRRTGDP